MTEDVIRKTTIPAPRRAGDVLVDNTAMTPDNFIDRTILNVRFKETDSFGTMATVEVLERDDDGNPSTAEFRTFSSVLVDQLEQLVARDAIPCIATVIEGKGQAGRPYYKLE